MKTAIELISSYRNDPDLVEVAQVFLDDLAVQIPRLQAAVAAADWAALERLAHYLKGGAASSGFPDYAELCDQLCQSARCGEVEALADLAAQVVELAGRLRAS